MYLRAEFLTMNDRLQMEDRIEDRCLMVQHASKTSMCPHEASATSMVAAAGKDRHLALKI